MGADLTPAEREKQVDLLMRRAEGKPEDVENVKEEKIRIQADKNKNQEKLGSEIHT